MCYDEYIETQLHWPSIHNVAIDRTGRNKDKFMSYYDYFAGFFGQTSQTQWTSWQSSGRYMYSFVCLVSAFCDLGIQ